MRTVIERVRRTVPVPPQVVQGSSMISPVPPQFVQGRAMPNAPEFSRM